MEKRKNSKGYIALNRSILDWQHYNESHYLIVFVTLLLTANHKERWWKGIKIQRGQTVISIRSLSMICGLSQPTIIKILKGLQKTGEIKRTKLNKLNSLTTIVQYNKFQNLSLESNKAILAESLAEQELYSNIYNTSLYNINKSMHEKILNDMLNGGILIEQFCKAEGITKNQFKNLAQEVINEWQLVGKTHKNESDARMHLLNHVRVKIRNRNLITDDKIKRLQPLIKDCKRLIEQGYPPEDVRNFYAYWVQPCNDNSGRMLFEGIKAFDAETKFKSFFKNK